MRILLLQPPIQDFYDTDIRLQPIGLCYLKAAARAWHPDVEVLVRDYHTGRGRKTIALPEELSYLREFYFAKDKSAFSTFHQYFHFGESFENIIEDIFDFQPDIVGISSLFTPYFREVHTIAKLIKQRQPNLPVLIGGSHVSAVPESVLQHPEIDYVITGEGERPFIELIDYFKGCRPLTSISNLGFKDDVGSLCFNRKTDGFELGDIPIPDFSDLETAHYKFEGKPLTFMITSRSCPHKCSFCSVHLTFGNRYRRRSIESVLAEIQQRYSEGYRVIDFEDDNLTFYKKEMKALCKLLIENFPQGHLQLVAMNGISYLSLDDELLELMKNAGFTHLNLALVSSDQTVRETTKRPHTVEKYLETVKKAFELGFKIVSYQILGLPNETLESMIQTLTFNAGLPVLLGASMFYQTPGAPISRHLPDLTEIDHFKARLTAMAIETQEFKREHLYTLFIVTRMINFLKGLKSDHDLRLSELINSSELEDMRILKDWRESGVLHMRTAHGPQQNLKFDSKLAINVLSRIHEFGLQNGRKVFNDWASVSFSNNN